MLKSRPFLTTQRWLLYLGDLDVLVAQMNNFVEEWKPFVWLLWTTKSTVIAPFLRRFFALFPSTLRSTLWVEVPQHVLCVSQFAAGEPRILSAHLVLISPPARLLPTILLTTHSTSSSAEIRASDCPASSSFGEIAIRRAASYPTAKSCSNQRALTVITRQWGAQIVIWPIVSPIVWC